MNGLLCCGNKFNSYTELPGDARNFWDSLRVRLYRWELVSLRVYLSTAERAGDTGVVTTTLFIIRKCDQFGSFHARYSFHQYTPSCSDVASGLRGPVGTELSQLIYRLSVAISLSAIERNDVTKSTATIRSPFCGYCYDTALFSVTPLFESVQHYWLPPTSIRTCSHMTT